MQLRDAGALLQFHQLLFASLSGPSPTLVDGPRFVETLSYARLIDPDCRVVYLYCDEAHRRQRYESNAGQLSWEQANALGTELSVMEFRRHSDLVFDTTALDPVVIADQIVAFLASGWKP
ncbi:hypothetical protein [Microcoleus sp.]|uniref:hypothetical protein n=1 Tax=Microcoleus sp. TaxID=44472 RepID=UPI0035240353